MPVLNRVEEVVVVLRRDDTKALLKVTRPVVSLVARQQQGAAGPQGAQGVPGVGGALFAEEFEIADPVPTEVELLHEPTTASLYINGLRQRMSAFSIAGQTVTLPPELSLMAGDFVTVEYVYEV